MPFREAIRDMGRYGSSLKPQDPYLSYHDVCLTKEDIDCVKGDWLTDNNISFWEEYLEHETLSKFPGNRIILLRPSMVFLLKSHHNPRELIEVLPNLRDASHIFLPINDNRNPALAEAGSHWSLLVVGVQDRVAFHYDSMTPSNVQDAQILHQKLQQLLGFGLRMANLEDTPQQDNGSDCGVHVCWAMRHLLERRLLVVERRREVDMSLGGKRLDATGMRRDMYKICEGLRKKASRRLSTPSSPSFASAAAQPSRKLRRRSTPARVPQSIPHDASYGSNSSSSSSSSPSWLNFGWRMFR